MTLKQIMFGLLHNKSILLVGITILVAGVIINYFSGLEGEMRIQAGKPVNLSVVSQLDSMPADEPSGLDFMVSLDSLRIHPYSPKYEIVVHERDTAITKELPPMGMPPTKEFSRHSLEKMKILKVGKTDFRFRLKEFYPDFIFSYTYPEKKDTIEPKAPGIILELNTVEGLPVVTLRSDQPNRNTLSDIVSLGASLAFYWNVSIDSLKVNDNGIRENKIIFSGSDRKVYFLFNEEIVERPLEENIYYEIPGRDSTGFTVLHCFPDIAYLKALPSTKGSEPLNPVANVEIWELGGKSQEVFLYPETRGRKGGDFWIPGSDFRLSFRISSENAIRSCDCFLSIRNHEGHILKSIALLSGQTKSYQGYTFKPVACNQGIKDEINIKISHNPGNKLILFGSSLSLIAIFLFFLSKKTTAEKATQ